jgi:hypothetical protein
MSATVTKLLTGDKDAIAIGRLCEKAKGSIVDSVKYLIEAGQKLAKKKDEVGHGEWLPWLKANADTLGFAVQKNACHTAARLIKLANPNHAPARDFTETEASQISKSVWGHTKRKASKPRESKRGQTTPQLDKAKEIVRAKLEAKEPISPHKLQEEYGISHVTFDMAITAVTAEMKLLDKFSVDPKTLAPSAQARLEIAKRQVERQLKAEHAERMRGLEEEIRQRVVAQGKDYIARMEEMETRAWEDQKHWRAMVNDHKPPFTKEQFRTVLMCLHPDGERTPEKLNQAFRLFNGKKLQLTGEK